MECGRGGGALLAVRGDGAGGLRPGVAESGDGPVDDGGGAAGGWAAHLRAALLEHQRYLALGRLLLPTLAGSSSFFALSMYNISLRPESMLFASLINW